MLSDKTKDILKRIENNDPTIKKFEFYTEEHLDYNNMLYIIRALQNNNNIKALYVHFKQPMTHEGIVCLADFLRNNQTIEWLYLQGSLQHSLEETIKYLCDALKYNKNIRVISFSQNNLRDKGAKHIATLIINNTTIRLIDLSDNDIGIYGAKVLAYALTINNNTLCTIRLQNNNFQDLGMKYITAAITHHKTLNAVSLSQNNYTDKGVEYALNMLSNNPVIEASKDIFFMNCKYPGLSITDEHEKKLLFLQSPEGLCLRQDNAKKENAYKHSFAMGFTFNRMLNMYTEYTESLQDLDLKDDEKTEQEVTAPPKAPSAKETPKGFMDMQFHYDCKDDQNNNKRYKKKTLLSPD